MKFNDEYIKQKMDSLQAEQYDLDLGWKKLERRMPSKKGKLIIWKYAAVASLVLLALTYFLLKNQISEEHYLVNQSQKNSWSKKDNANITFNKKGSKSIIKKYEERRVEVPILAANGKKTNTKRQIRSPEISTETVIAKSDRQKNPFLAEEYPKEKNTAELNSENERKTKTLPTLSISEFGALVNSEVEPKISKQAKLKKYFTNRCQQNEYIGEKLSSEQILIKF